MFLVQENEPGNRNEEEVLSEGLFCRHLMRSKSFLSDGSSLTRRSQFHDD
jgi:hypothetical protein